MLRFSAQSIHKAPLTGVGVCGHAALHAAPGQVHRTQRKPAGRGRHRQRVRGVLRGCPAPEPRRLVEEESGSCGGSLCSVVLGTKPRASCTQPRSRIARSLSPAWATDRVQQWPTQHGETWAQKTKTKNEIFSVYQNRQPHGALQAENASRPHHAVGRRKLRLRRLSPGQTGAACWQQSWTWRPWAACEIWSYFYPTEDSRLAWGPRTEMHRRLCPGRLGPHLTAPASAATLAFFAVWTPLLPTKGVAFQKSKATQVPWTGKGPRSRKTIKVSSSSGSPKDISPLSIQATESAGAPHLLSTYYAPAPRLQAPSMREDLFFIGRSLSGRKG